ncbi:phage tail tape measure protein [Xanthocytophaga agilis]|uniref:Phage tail tape measure protein n=1 Tax=Xanthocytophaga agilis TaxID=3048010 RepID=A0AAE3R2N6_9BACT|nr:phage tail tape measure protein [Xanthocytophaga agilis]MDJ1500502.1 phage tail tape measure protein [Xanthocytophaga agilis]
MESAVKILNGQLKKLPQGTEEFIKKSEELKSVRQRLKDVKDDVYALDKASKDVAVTSEQVTKSSGSSWSSLGSIIAGGIVAAIGMAVMAVINFGKEAYELAKTYSDSFADIRKSTGMTADEVQALNDRIGDLDTRTSQLDLLEIAKVGGQIGIAAKEMDGFVESTDKAVVALGDEFSGGAEEVAGKLGTLKSLFQETKDLDAGTAINKIGSALNELGATGSAKAPVVADFASRIGQLGNLAPEIGQTLGLGAAFQELGLSAEISAGGLSNILLTASKSTDKFSQHLGMTEQAFKDLINTDPNEVIFSDLYPRPDI